MPGLGTHKHIPVCVLGVYVKEYRFTAEDYKIYKHDMVEFLRGPRGRAAILMGGLAARIARDIVNMEEVYAGPTDFVNAPGKPSLFVEDQHSKFYGFWDDGLSQEEEDFIFGTYDIET
ncbi:hypothetical protein MPER_14636, partial [Moniliophthora perniciosa FA553]